MIRAIIALLLICGAVFAQQKQSAKPASVKLDELELRDSVYFYPGEKVPYSGKVVYSDCTECGGPFYSGNMKNGKWHGKWEMFDHGYTYTGNYVDGKKHGQWKFSGDYEESGVENYKNGEKHGEWKVFLRNGKIKSVTTYKDGNGWQKEFYENGKLNVEGNTKDGIKQGEWKEFHRNGKLKSVKTYNDGKENGEMKEFYENGKLKSIKTYNDGNEDGEMKEFYENGKLNIEWRIKDGMLHGEWKFYSENEKLMSVRHYKDGEKDGKWEEYYENGQLRSVEHYKDREKDGKWEEYYENGQLRSVVYYKDGKRDGKRELYDENGKPMQLGSFSDQRDGKIYTTVKIGSQTWMAENLNYNVNGSKCYRNDESNCQKYGKLYNWATAMTVCPSGWHLPDKNEWEILDKAVGGEKEAAEKLRASSGWDNNNGTDEFGFSALPGGSGSGVLFLKVGSHGYWWSASENNSRSAYYRLMYYNHVYAKWDSNFKSYLYSVRCLQD